MLAKPKPHDGTRPVTDWKSAQEYTNFVLLRPSSKSGWRFSEATVRGESEKQYSSLRIVVERAGVKVRFKQTLNDWWVPVSNDVNLRRVESHALVGDEVIMLGKDYHGRPGACAQILGTTVEAFIMEGMPLSSHWPDCFAALEAAVPEAVAESRKLSFSERNYWERWNRDVGPWDSHEFTAPHWMRPDPATFKKIAWASAPDAWAPMPGAPDSIADLIKNSRHEMQVLFRQPMTLNYTSWRRTVEPKEPEGPVAARDPRYPKLAKTAKVADRDVRYAALQEAVGPWFFAWEENGRQEELHLRAKKGFDEKAALETLKAILTTNR